MRTVFSRISKGLFLFSSMIDFIMWRYSALRDLFMLLVKIGAVIATFEFFLACSNRLRALAHEKGVQLFAHLGNHFGLGIYAVFLSGPLYYTTLQWTFRVWVAGDPIETQGLAYPSRNRLFSSFITMSKQ